jgi:hypothetical protein
VTEQEAENVARRYIESHADPSCGDIQVLQAETIGKEYGWIFFYQSKKYLDTGAIEDLLAGNGPVLVERSGRVVQLPTAISLEESLKRYESGQPLLPRPKPRSEM